MAQMEYWECVVGEILSNNGIDPDKATLAAVTKDFHSAADMEWEATGQEHIPDPRDTELERVKRELKEAKAAENTWREAMAFVGRVPARALSREGDQIICDPRY